MSNGMVVVDTSVWVEFFNRPGSLHHTRIDELLDLDRVAITGVIAAELIRGCREARERSRVETALEGVKHLELPFESWLTAGREMFDLRRKGVTVSLSDASIATACRASGALLYTLDHDFDRFADLARYGEAA